jgi:enoyl-[acyl-carrier protein] reductase II
MVWCSGWRLAAAASNAGALGVIGSGSMYPDVLNLHLQRMREASTKPFAVNLPLLYPDIAAHLDAIEHHRVPVVITSAGNPSIHTKRLKDAGCIVGHVVSSTKFALKAQSAGVDFVIAEGFEAGGHNGRDETTTMVLIPSVADAIELPLVAAGGIGDARSMLAAMVLGADGVQIGSRFVLAEESSAHEAFKNAVQRANEGDTLLTLKELTPVRLLKGGFLSSVLEAYNRGASADELKALLGKGRAKKGMFEGDLENGELEIGQIAGRFNTVHAAADIIAEIVHDYGVLGAPQLGKRFNF